jgi:hypothetical protein
MNRVGYVFDDRLTLHSEARKLYLAKNTFPEFPERIRAIHANFQARNVLQFVGLCTSPVWWNAWSI